MLPDRLSNPGPLTYESGALPIALRGPAFQQGTIGQHCVGPKILFTDEMFGSNLFLSDKIVIVKTNAFGIYGGRLVLGLFYILNM